MRSAVVHNEDSAKYSRQFARELIAREHSHGDTSYASQLIHSLEQSKLYVKASLKTLHDKLVRQFRERYFASETSNVGSDD